MTNMNENLRKSGISERFMQANEHEPHWPRGLPFSMYIAANNYRCVTFPHLIMTGSKVLISQLPKRTQSTNPSHHNSYGIVPQFLWFLLWYMLVSVSETPSSMAMVSLSRRSSSYGSRLSIYFLVSAAFFASAVIVSEKSLQASARKVD
jgi:hypothetical protein